MISADKLWSAQSLQRSRPIIKSRPRQHRGVHEPLTPSGSPLLVITPHGRPTFIRHTDDRNAKTLSQFRHDRENRRESVHVLVHVKMSQREALAAESFNLRRQLLFDLVKRHPATQA